MKAISFFCVVFVSMLAAFLVATGEVTRWFSGSDGRRQLVFNPAPTSPESSPNMLYFPFYNVELGKLSFTIRAELSQDDLEVKDKFDEIRHLTLRNGSLDIPVYDGLALGSTPTTKKREPKATEGDDSGSLQQITLTFETAEWQRPPSRSSSKDGMKVVLTNGRGSSTSDDFSFGFEELLFLYRSVGEADSYEVSSDRPVSIRSEAFELQSPSGLRGKLRGDGIGLETLTFLPPVTAIIDRKRAPFFQYATGQESGAGDESSSTEQEDGRLHRIVITSQGSLELQALQPKEGEPRRTVIGFHDDVVIKPETSSDAVADSGRTRFECQYLELAFEEVARRLVPIRALATWDGGRVKAYFEPGHQRGKEGYVVDGDRLEWIYRAPSEADAPPEATVSRATLYGNPTMTGKDNTFTAREALLDLAAARVLLADVSGRFRIGSSAESPRSEADPDRRRIESRIEGRRGEEPEVGSLPEDWDMKADEVEFFFSDSPGTIQKLSHFIARSDGPRGVIVESVAGEPEAAAEPMDQIGQLRLTSKQVTYRAAEKMITFEGSGESRPRFTQGENHIESRRIHLLLKKNEELALFEDEVFARIVDSKQLAAVSESSGPPAGSVGSERGRSPDGPVELSAAQVTAGLAEDGKTISFLRAAGTEAVPARIQSMTGNRFVIEGAELEWNRQDETAIVWGVAPGPSERTGARHVPVPRSREEPSEDVMPAPPRLALLEFEGGQLKAESISFDQKNQTAYLERYVILECTDGSKSVVVHTGRAEVEFFEGAPSGRRRETGFLHELRKVKSFRAHRSERSPIELIGQHFRAYADEAVWDAATSELRFLGRGKQEIKISNEHFEGPIYAREVVYSVRDNLVTLRGEVEGHLTQRLADGASAADRPMEWRFETSRLELQLQASRAGTPELKSLHAREWVHLTSTKEELALRLLGDALDFDAASGKVTVFSPAGRPQTFFRMNTAETVSVNRDSALAGKNRDEIIAQRIVLLPVRFPEARFGVSRSWLNVLFEQNVKAVFRPARDSGIRSSSSRRLGGVASREPWKLDTEKLVLRVDPGQAPAGMVTWATAQGGVIFKLGNYTATGDRAEYRDLSQKVTLTGDPARLSGEDEQGRPYKYENDRIVILREADQIAIEMDSRRARSGR